MQGSDSSFCHSPRLAGGSILRPYVSQYGRGTASEGDISPKHTQRAYLCCSAHFAHWLTPWRGMT